VQLVPADTLILYSDGVTEAHDMQGQLFGEERLQQAAIANVGRSAQELQDTLMATLQEFMAAAPQFDDITLAVVVREQ
jgi:sigma-B regulation protein RsbU (phosphoserine phosphatase)